MRGRLCGYIWNPDFTEGFLEEAGKKSFVEWGSGLLTLELQIEDKSATPNLSAMAGQRLAIEITVIPEDGADA